MESERGREKVERKREKGTITTTMKKRTFTTTTTTTTTTTKKDWCMDAVADRTCGGSLHCGNQTSPCTVSVTRALVEAEENIERERTDEMRRMRRR